jgi:NAD(P)-dependent dehydrogenase (short-subunit alcohol dehydrogenase family)
VKLTFLKQNYQMLKIVGKQSPFTLEKFSQIDILVNAAGLTDRGNIVETSEELFDKMIGTNVKGPFFLIQDTVKDMIQKETKGFYY